MSRFAFGPLLCVALLLSACGSGPIAIPEGEQTVHAHVVQVPFSLKRRGTHALQRDGKTFAYAESMTISLEDIAGDDVDLIGTFERNSDPTDFPVLVVQEIRGRTSAKMKPWSIPALTLSLNLPSHWKGDIRAGTAEFSASGTVMLRMTERTALSDHASSDGEEMIVGLRQARVELDTEGSKWTVRVTGTKSRPDTIFVFSIDPVLPIDSQLHLFRRILSSVSFTGSTAASVAPIPSPSSAAPSSSGPGTPCGGSAGILCPAGYTCVISPGTDSGTCRKR